MIEEFTARAYGCLHDVTVKLTPLHAVIGPNDSGKSTLLRAIRMLCNLVEHNGSRMGLVSDDSLLRSASIANKSILLSARSTGKDLYGVSGAKQWMEWLNMHPAPLRGTLSDSLSILRRHESSLSAALASARMIRLRPEEIRQPTALLDSTQPLRFLNEHGRGLGAVLDAIRDRDEDAWRKLIEDVRRHFPSVKRLQLQVQSFFDDGGKRLQGKVVATELHDGSRVSINDLSEGFLYYLAFAAMRHLDPVSILCVEEPENGLHPARIREVVNILRALSTSGTQVILSTHSPLVLNELRPEEITVLVRPNGAGTVATRLIDVPLYRERTEAEKLLPGELWVSYCDGDLERLLLHPQSAEPA